MSKILIFFATCLLLCSCGGAARKAEKEAQKARTEYRQSVIDSLKTKAEEARTLYVTYRAFGYIHIKESDIITDDRLNKLMDCNTDEQFEGLKSAENDLLDFYIRVMTEDIENTRAGHEMIRQELERMDK